MPFRIPTSRSPSAVNRSCSPNPPSAVRMQPLRPRGDLGKCRERSETEERNPPGVVRIVRAVVAVDARPVEKVGVLDEEDLRTPPWPGRRAIQPRPLGMPAERDRERRTGALERRRGLAHDLVQRHENGGRQACGGLTGRQTAHGLAQPTGAGEGNRKSTRLNSSHSQISYAVFCLKKKKNK